MIRALLLVLMSAVSVVVTAAPTPEDGDAAKLERTYGRWADPDKGSRYTLTRTSLRVELPGERRLLTGGPSDRANAPRVTREVEGDFAVMVRITFTGPSIPKDVPGFSAGGLIAAAADKESVLARACDGLWLQNDACCLQHVAAGGDPVRTQLQSVRPAPRPVWLQLERQGRTVVAGWSSDGMTWRKFRTCRVGWGARVQVGLIAENDRGVPAEVTFDRYTLTRPQPAKEATP